MYHVRRSFGLAALALLLAGPAGAQGGKELVLQATAGGLRGLTNLNRLGSYDTKLGAGFAGSIGLKVADQFVVRGDVGYSATPIRFLGEDYGQDYSRVFTTLFGQIQVPLSSGLVPYALAGGGAAFLNQHTGSDPKQTRGHFAAGAGLGYRVGGSPFMIAAETRLYLYDAKGLVGGAPSDKTVQSDVFFGLGLSYSFPIGSR